ncbi:hypothetical protein Tco_1246578 [Tanacetum coccineum]
MNTTQAQQKALDDALVAPADHLEFGKCNMRLKTDIKPKEATFQVVLDALALTPFYQAFLITTEVPAVYMQEFYAIVSIHKSSIRFKINKKKVSLDVDIDLGYSGDIIYLTDVNFDYLHQPWRAFATVINKCLSGKEIGMDKIHFVFQIENKYAKKTNKMSYLRFTKIIIHYFMSKDQSILRRNKMFWHTARDDTMFTFMRCISRHKDTQVYGTILPKELINQAMLDSKAYQTYYAFASGEKALKPKLKSKAKVAKSKKKKQPAKMPKAKGLNVLSEVPGVPKYDSESEEESWTFSQDDEYAEGESNKNDDSEETESDNDEDDLTHPNLSTYKEEDDDKDKEGEHEEEEDDMYRDLNINVERSDAEMTDAQANQDMKDTHATLTTVPSVVQHQSSSVSSDLVSKFINPSPDTGFDSILNQDTQSDNLINVSVFIAAETSSSVTTIPQPHIPNIQPLQQTPTSTTITNPTMTLP